MVADAIHSPNDERHFMRIATPAYTVTATAQEQEIANSSGALKVKEVGFDVYDPVIYFPRRDVSMNYLAINEKTTHCPLKGDTEYFNIVLPTGTIENGAWSYNKTIEIAADLEGYIAFDVRHVQIIELTAG